MGIDNIGTQVQPCIFFPALCNISLCVPFFPRCTFINSLPLNSPLPFYGFPGQFPILADWDRCYPSECRALQYYSCPTQSLDGASFRFNIATFTRVRIKFPANEMVHFDDIIEISMISSKWLKKWNDWMKWLRPKPYVSYLLQCVLYCDILCTQFWNGPGRALKHLTAM